MTVIVLSQPLLLPGIVSTLDRREKVVFHLRESSNEVDEQKKNGTLITLFTDNYN